MFVFMFKVKTCLINSRMKLNEIFDTSASYYIDYIHHTGEDFDGNDYEFQEFSSEFELGGDDYQVEGKICDNMTDFYYANFNLNLRDEYMERLKQYDEPVAYVDFMKEGSIWTYGDNNKRAISIFATVFNIIKEVVQDNRVRYLVYQPSTSIHKSIYERMVKKMGGEFFRTGLGVLDKEYIVAKV